MYRTLWLLGISVLALLALGLLVLASASGENGTRLFNDNYHFLWNQGKWLVLAVPCMLAAMFFDYHRWRERPWMTIALYLGVLALMAAVFLFPPIKGSRRWLPLGPVRLQPSEFAKLAVVIVVSVWLDRAAWRVELFRRGALVPALLIGFLALPVMAEPDFGSTMVIGFSGFLVMFVAGTRLLHLAPFAVVGICAFVYKVATNANRMARIAAFFGVKIDVGAQVMDEAARRAAYQANQALVAMMNGGVWGVGLTQSMQKQKYLPENHTDFIFAIGAEELGIIFSVGTLLLFLAFFLLSVYIARSASDRFGRFLALGMAFIIFFQAIFNIGVVCEALPTKGMALPFFSYGGTNMLASFFAVGTILSVGIHSYRDRKREKLRKMLVR